jgi:mRNA-degrading endonuclease RelE of RelBE toxin-antitoxin system
MVSSVVCTDQFERAVRKLKDAAVRERIKNQVAEIVGRPDIGKPLRHQLKGERAVWVPPFRIIYAVVGDTLYLLDFRKRDEAYRRS